MPIDYEHLVEILTAENKKLRTEIKALKDKSPDLRDTFKKLIKKDLEKTVRITLKKSDKPVYNGSSYYSGCGRNNSSGCGGGC